MNFDPQKTLREAQKRISRGDIQRAVEAYERLVAHDPRNDRFRIRLAELLVRNKSRDRAVEQFLQMARKYEGENWAYRAIAMYKKVLTINPKMVDVCHQLADLYKREGLLGTAKRTYQTILKIDPEDQCALGAIEEMNRSLAAEDSVKKEIEKPAPPEASKPEQSHSWDHEPLSEEGLTVDDTEKAPESFPGGILHDDEILELVAVTAGTEDPNPFGENRDTDDTQPRFTHQRVDIKHQVSPEKELECHYHLGIAYTGMGLFDEAASEFEEALAYRPKQVDCLVMLGRCYAEKGDFERAVLYLEKASLSDGLTRELQIRIDQQLEKVCQTRGITEK